ncbi:M15 family metallopeptidase [Pseudidiomarina sp.]|uniref:M15 family metallopeptidase n=1 Tax=Pseudidiomarina sp. TaxID=2081707 RepID=UPI00299F3C5D|nr:M15 family metallopeptidase [Pseudidiomarina sp.]MDX1705714.1 M15 family metallopeptidase [Pseudidiomarina sp.]
MLTPNQLTGRSAAHVTTSPGLSDKLRLQETVWGAFLLMRKAACDDGIDIAIASAFRDFDRQLLIWNKKFNGELPLYSDRGERLEPQQLSAAEKIQAILTWSALPGASRHHWGTDFDVYDPRPFAHGSRQLELVAAEYQDGGPCFNLYTWLQQHAASYGFFFPYARYQGGVAAEPWHLSYADLAQPASSHLTTDLLHQTLAAIDEEELAGKQLILEQLPEIKRSYIDNICPPGPPGETIWFG